VTGLTGFFVDLFAPAWFLTSTVIHVCMAAGAKLWTKRRSRTAAPPLPIMQHLAVFVLIASAVANAISCSNVFWWPFWGGLVATLTLLAAAGALLLRSGYGFALMGLAIMMTLVVQLGRRDDYARGERDGKAWLVRREKEYRECCEQKPGWCVAVPLTCRDPFGELGHETAVDAAPFLRIVALFVIGGSVAGSLLGTLGLVLARRRESRARS
jgi:hypothetical protein